VNNKEYITRVEEIKTEHKEALRGFAIEFALEHSNVAVGDIISDHIGSICVVKVLFHTVNIPFCKYRGICYTKKGLPYKSGEQRTIYQENLRGA